MERLEKVLADLLNTKITRSEFIKLITKILATIFLLSLIPLKFTPLKNIKPKIKVKFFKFQEMYQSHNLAG